MLKHTKIVATVSDQRCDVDFVSALYKAGMNVVRLNSAHMSEEGFNRVVGNVRAVSNHIGILMDTKGPEIRTTITKEPLDLKTGDIIKVMGNPEGETNKDCICVSYKNFVTDMSVGGALLIDDGDLDLKVIEKYPDYLLCEVQNDAKLGSRKSVNVPGVRINLPSLTEKDRNSIQFCIDNNLDFIAHSFVRTKQDVLDIQRILDEQGSPIKIIAKIENQEGVDNIDEILEAAYGIMIARGDLGIEVPQEKIPGIQRVLIRKCVEAKKPVIVATQMLHSMINNPRPTRAEVTDIANAIYYRTDALMLSGETAYGKYPVEAVATMTKIAAEAEKTKLAANDIRVPIVGNDLDVTSFLAKQAVKASSKLHVKAIITDSFTGKTARYLAAFRGTSTVYAICYRERLTRELALSYGVWAVYQEESKSEREYYFKALNELIKSGRITRSDMVAYLSGSFGEGGGTTFLEINNVGKILDAGNKYTLPTFKE
ncbi:MAG: pyruvate kinase [Parabacteroides sp.]|jgi:pyruvate kinase|nr:pyruvate kinase [Parabacteroides sp.]MBP8759536.1 pyruvate kinase [Parabacteroides sp.]MBP9479997.1 pyruvate kinase [Parabacteroides sp.]MBP9577995.1 pyruvate kinase [Parabacteroides sp.]MDD2415374.1 pyruvate kinase [Parabacteroides sp.]